MIENENNNRRDCPISCQTLGWYHTSFGDQNAADAFSFIQSCGFEAVDYHFEGLYTASQIRSGSRSPVFDQPVEKVLEYFAPVKEALEARGIFVSQAHGISPKYLSDNKEMNRYLHAVIEKTLEVCRFLKCPYLVLHPIRMLNRSENVELFQKLIPAASKSDVRICMENMFLKEENGNAPFYDAVTACRMIDELNEMAGREIFGICFDVGHANITGRNLYEDVCAYGNRLMCLHIHDNDGTHDQHLIPYTQKKPGVNSPCTDWDGLYDGLSKINYKGPVNFEIHPSLRIVPPELMEDALKFTASTGRYIRDRILSTSSYTHI